MRLHTDPAIRQALYGLYIALFRAKRICPDDFQDRRLTTIQTAIMGIENLGWRVVGITREALDLLATEDFRKNRLPRRLCRGHIVDRIQTTRLLFAGSEPMSLDDFFDKFLQNDRTVIMLNEQNSRARPFPPYIDIDNPDGKLFPNGPLISWKHRKMERDYLRSVHSQLRRTRSQSKIRASASAALGLAVAVALCAGDTEGVAVAWSCSREAPTATAPKTTAKNSFIITEFCLFSDRAESL